jgi:hypothetical protein
MTGWVNPPQSAVLLVRRYAGCVSLLRAGTQVAKITSMRLYETCGFRMAGTLYVPHARVFGSNMSVEN